MNVSGLRVLKVAHLEVVVFFPYDLLQLIKKAIPSLKLT